MTNVDLVQPRGVTRRQFPADPRSVGSARRVVSGVCQSAGYPEALCEMTMLLTSETVTNAVVHGRSDVTLAINAGPAGMRVEVTDGAQQLPVRRCAGQDSEGGRGIALLEALASAWGTEELLAGKTVWFELQL